MIYVFSLSDESFDEKFSDVKQKLNYFQFPKQFWEHIREYSKGKYE